jgi:glycine oxidase
MSSSIAIVGAGLIGRILALECSWAGFSVSLFDRDNKEGKQSCAATGAGMLAPYTELQLAESIIAALGIESLSLWPEILNKLCSKVFFQTEGTLVLAHPQDQPELLRFKRAVQYNLENHNWNNFDFQLPKDILLNCNRPELLSLESQLPSIFIEGIYLPGEGQIDNNQILHALGSTIERTNIQWHSQSEINSLNELSSCDYIIDCRGLGSKPDIKQLRGVRGELLLIEAPDVILNRPIRLMHPRHPIYIVPRQNNRFIIGATSIESEDMGPITVQSSLELLSAACTVHPAFAEASVLESKVNCRPTLLNNLPGIIFSEEKPSDNIIRVNGLYRHGFLMAPQLAKLVLAFIKSRTIAPSYSELFHLVDESKNVKGETAFAISH